MIILGLVMLFASDAGAETPHGQFLARVVAVIDGDTLTVLDASDVQHKIRLNGIDAPEKRQAFGAASRKSLGDKLHDKDVRIAWKTRDRYGRILGDIYIGDRHINREMVSEGVAWWYRRYAPEAMDLEEAEADARKERRGLWRDDAPVAPWEFRKQARDKRAVDQK